jgi:hypothetical protein
MGGATARLGWTSRSAWMATVLMLSDMVLLPVDHLA